MTPHKLIRLLGGPKDGHLCHIELPLPPELHFPLPEYGLLPSMVGWQRTFPKWGLRFSAARYVRVGDTPIYQYKEVGL